MYDFYLLVRPSGFSAQMFRFTLNYEGKTSSERSEARQDRFHLLSPFFAEQRICSNLLVPQTKVQNVVCSTKSADAQSETTTWLHGA